jgi:hypothetical protein
MGWLQMAFFEKEVLSPVRDISSCTTHTVSHSSCELNLGKIKSGSKYERK